MTVDYVQWKNEEVKNSIDVMKKCFDELQKGRELRLISLYPEFELKPEDVYTLWVAPGSPQQKQASPQTNLANLVTHYNKIIMPINLCRSKQEFEYANAISLESIIRNLKENPGNYIPVTTGPESDYKAAGFYDGIFETCHSLYGHYPVDMAYRSTRFMEAVHLTAKALARGDRPVRSAEEARARFPEFNIEWIRQNEVDQILGRDVDGLRLLSERIHAGPLDVSKHFATTILSLRACGHEDLVEFILKDMGEICESITTPYHILDIYEFFLVMPVSHCLGGFGNYTTNDLKNMAFLRILPLVTKDLKELDRTNLRLLFNSPGARSPVNLESYKMQVFLKGGDDVNTLNELVGFAERHKKETRAMSEYRESVARGKFSEATKALMRSGEVYGQISEEVEELAKKEKTAKLATYSMTGGATILSDIAIVLQQGLPLEWKLVIMLFKDLFGSRIKDIDPKRVVEWIYDIRDWPWYEKGIPYLYWRASESRSP